MPAWPLLIVGICIFISLSLFYPVRVETRMRLQLPRGGDGELTISFLHGLILMEYVIEINVQDLNRFLLVYQKGKEPKVVLGLYQKKEKKKMKKITFPIMRIWPHINVSRLSISGALGIRENAALTALLVGYLKGVIQCVFILLCKDKKGFSPDVAIMPAYNHNEFLINLEGIALCSPIHIITAIVFYGSKTRKGKKAAWRILSKTS